MLKRKDKLTTEVVPYFHKDTLIFEVSYHPIKLFNIFINGAFWPILYSVLWPRTWGAWCNVLNVINQFRSATCHFISLSLNILLIYIIFPKLKLKRAIDSPLSWSHLLYFFQNKINIGTLFDEFIIFPKRNMIRIRFLF